MHWATLRRKSDRRPTSHQLFRRSRRHLACLLLIAMSLFGTRESVYGMSPLYHYTVVAKDGMTTSDGYVIDAIEPDVSVNEEGKVAFTARIGQGDQLLVGWKPSDVRNISRSPDGRNFSYPQINNEDWVVTRELYAGQSIIRRWDARNPGNFQIVVSTTLSFFTQVSNPTIANFPRGVRPLPETAERRI